MFTETFASFRLLWGQTWFSQGFSWYFCCDLQNNLLFCFRLNKLSHIFLNVTFCGCDTVDEKTIISLSFFCCRCSLSRFLCPSFIHRRFRIFSMWLMSDCWMFSNSGKSIGWLRDCTETGPVSSNNWTCWGQLQPPVPLKMILDCFYKITFDILLLFFNWF